MKVHKVIFFVFALVINGTSFEYDKNEEMPSFFWTQTENNLYVKEYLINSTIQLEANKDHVTFYFYTKEKPNDPFPLKVEDVSNLTDNKYYNSNKKNVFISHGWNNNYKSPVNELIKSALLEFYDVNIFVVDWSEPANRNYITARTAVPEIGKTVAEFINNMLTLFKIKPSDFILIGHSLGAHVAGYAGASTNGLVDIIVGLDPAKPLFFNHFPNDRLDKSDAAFVHIIHTCGAFLGFSDPIGHADYYPNGGMRQPGCGIDLACVCAHSRSYEYFAESLTNDQFVSRQCNTLRDYLRGKCFGNLKSFMGGFVIDKGVQGDFFLKTNTSAPYGIGEGDK